MSLRYGSEIYTGHGSEVDLQEFLTTEMLKERVIFIMSGAQEQKQWD